MELYELGNTAFDPSKLVSFTKSNLHNNRITLVFDNENIVIENFDTAEQMEKEYNELINYLSSRIISKNQKNGILLYNAVHYVELNHITNINCYQTELECDGKLETRYVMEINYSFKNGNTCIGYDNENECRTDFYQLLEALGIYLTDEEKDE